MPAKKTKDSFLLYKGKPLVRSGNIIYYGNMSDKYVVMLQILSSRPFGDMETAERVSVQLQYTDPDIKSRDRIVKKTEKDGLYNAIDIGAIWLERALEN
jgi:hypothetical protein